jgi:dipeptidyl aminopeptidase/acylaminoacyl peptidase
MKKFFLSMIVSAFVLSSFAQDALTAKDYQKAESMMGYNTQQYVDRGNVSANWFAGDKFWYRILTPQGSEFILVDAAKGTKTPAFDHQKLAEAISKATDRKYSASMLPFMSFSYAADGKSINFRAANKQLKYDLQTNSLTEDASQPSQPQRPTQGFGRGLEVLSPDGSKAAFIKEYNLWIRDIKTGEQKQLTTDGIKDYGYATDNAGWRGSDRPVLRWSPDSKKIATFRQDQRKTGDMYLVSTNVGHPNLRAWKYPLPGDSNVTMIERCIINIDEPKVTFFKMEQDQHRGTLSDDISSSGTFDDVDWSADGSELAFVSTSRDHKNEKFRIANTMTGDIREVFEETVTTQFESGQGAINWRYFPKTNEIIWYSERDNWGHLYLYDAKTKNRTIYFVAAGLQNENPYFNQLCKIGFDGKNFAILTPEAGNHSISFSPSENYFIDTYSKPDVPSVSMVKDMNGKKIVDLEKTDVSRLKATGWKPPMPFSVKAHDGKTDIYGIMFTPTDLDPTKKYPVVDYIYPGPQGGSVGSWSFSASRSDHQALAELGFVVVLIEGTGNPDRSKSFHDMYWPDMSTNTLPDQVAGIRQLAQRYSYIDTNRVGIWGHSGGGFATASALFKFPDFFKVGVSQAGNHDNRNYEDDWGERYIGLLTKGPDGKDNYEIQANQTHAKNLKGKLMLAHGLMDNNVPPYNTWLVVDALNKANKDYDLVIFPNAGHGFGADNPYMMRRRWDYFVKNLLGKEPPKEYKMGTNTDPRNNLEPRGF